ncbi:MAG: sensor histidine kinase, partial [Porticoccaceae bacterium]
IKRCKNTLKKLLMTAEENQSSSSVAVPVEQYFADLVERWQIMRPDLRVSISLQADQRLAVFHPTVEQSLINLLNNAADASPEVIDLDISYSGDMANITIRDYGSGLNGRTMDELGQAFVSHKAEGLGLGLFLSQATLSRFGGSVCLGNAPGGGTMTQITLPLRLNSETVPTEPAA